MTKQRLEAFSDGVIAILKLMAAVAKDRKGQISRWLYAVAIRLAFVHQWLSDALYVLVAVMWFAPDPRIERTLKKNAG